MEWGSISSVRRLFISLQEAQADLDAVWHAVMHEVQATSYPLAILAAALDECEHPLERWVLLATIFGEPELCDLVRKFVPAPPSIKGTETNVYPKGDPGMSPRRTPHRFRGSGRQPLD
jgi:hypothetical protein